MDMNAYWQENKRFLLSVMGGVVVFLIGWMLIDSFFGSDLRSQRARKSQLESKLKQPMFASGDLSTAKSENEALRAVVDELSAKVEFSAREEFALGDGHAPSSRYFAVVTDVRDELRSRCSRAGLSIPENLGLPALSPTREQEIERYLEALDVIESTIQMGIETGVERLDKIVIDLDTRLLSNKPIDDLEQTMIEFRFVGPSPPLVEMLTLLQQERHDRVLLVDRVDMQPARSKEDEVRMDLVLLVAHLHGLGAEQEEEG
jgi:hypothetical protein